MDRTTAPNNSFKPTPHRGAAYSGIRFPDNVRVRAPREGHVVSEQKVRLISTSWSITRAPSCRLLRGAKPRTGPQSDRDASVRSDEGHSCRAAGDAQAAFRTGAHHLLDRGHRRSNVCTAYAAAKFGIEGWMESLTPEIAPFGSGRCWSSLVFSVRSCSPTTRHVRQALHRRLWFRSRRDA
jgi:hypothetical protein